MQAAIYIQIINDIGSYTYNKPILNQLKHHFPQLVVFDFDTQSESFVAGYAADLLEKAAKVLIIIEASEGPPSGLINFMEKIIACKDKCMVLVYGHNSLVERMLKLLDKENFVHAEIDTHFTELAIRFLSVREP
jgi:hypothetical protein